MPDHTNSQPTCGRCGVYRHLHPTSHCVKPRRSWWWDRHSLVRHVAGWAWIKLPAAARWRIVGWFDRPKTCWCNLVDAAYKPDLFAEDFQAPWGCLCDVPLPTDAGAPRPGYCYCGPVKKAS